MNYLNEIDEYAAQWLRNLIDAGLLPPAVVDTRSIVDVTPGDLAGFRQCHFFAGIGVWPLALRRAGVPDDADLWTGSCPCQPFSAAGAGAGMDDERHLWPHFEHLIRQRRPAKVLGEQVAGKDADPWIDLVQTDMEAMGYAFGAVAFPSAGVGAPHIRDRTYWVGNANHARLEGWKQPECERGVERPTGASGVAPELERWKAFDERPPELRTRPGPDNGFWADADWLLCRDGKWRPVEPGTFPLVDGAPARVGRLRAYGNAINLEAARVFIECVMQPTNGLDIAI